MAQTESITIGERTITPGDRVSDNDRDIVFDRAELGNDGQLHLVFTSPSKGGEEVRVTPIEFLHNCEDTV